MRLATGSRFRHRSFPNVGTQLAGWLLVLAQLALPLAAVVHRSGHDHPHAAVTDLADLHDLEGEPCGAAGEHADHDCALCALIAEAQHRIVLQVTDSSICPPARTAVTKVLEERNVVLNAPSADHPARAPPTLPC